MYVKIVRHLEDEQGVSDRRGTSEKVVPSEHYIFECLEAQYRKVTVSKMSEFHKRMDNFETVRIVTPIPEKEVLDVVSGQVEKDCPFEFIQIKTTIKEGDNKFVNETLIARTCTLFIMNNEGKTIDSLVCL